MLSDRPPNAAVVAGIGADDDAVTSWECTGCKALVSLLQDLFLKNATEDEIVKIITAFCIDLKIEDELVCRGIVTEFKVSVTIHGRARSSTVERA